jgi:thiamine biosynthesis lipoprotein
VTLANCAISTSGDSWQFVQIAGQRYSHIIDPKTGLGLTRRSSVTVVAKDCTTADAYATAVSVLGPSRGTAAIDRLDRAAVLVVVKEGEKHHEFASTRWKHLPTEKAPQPPSSVQPAGADNR